jgi:hypothetical protein
MNQDKELKACPFCGDNVTLDKIDGYASTQWVICCWGCGISVQDEGKTRLLSMWNTRHNPPHETVELVRGASIKNTHWHDAGAYGRCSHCGRYSDDAYCLDDRVMCDCGRKGGFSGSFKKPTKESNWVTGKPPKENEDG